MRLAAMVSLAVLSIPSPGLLAQGTAKPADQYRADVLALSRRIDQLIEAKWKDAGLRAAPMAHDGQYFRRLNLDLTGRIPNLLDIRDYMDRTWTDEENAHSMVARTVGLLTTPYGAGAASTGGFLAACRIQSLADKRWDWVEKMLSEETYGRHFAAMWRSLILAGNTNQQAQGLQPGFENWLRQHLRNNTPYDKMARELLTASPFGGGNMYQGGASPAAFYFANENKPENLAGASARMFLGVKLDCAQCHPHPFAKWTQKQFWEFAAFFGGIQQNVRGGIQPPAVQSRGREIQIPGTNKIVKAKFLNGVDPVWKEGVDSRTVLADWITSAENPFFAKAAVDHIWSYFFGVSLLEPIYEPNEDYPVVHEELVDEMARQLIAQKFDVKFLIRAIAHTQAYQRTSEAMGKDVNKDDILFFARMPVRGLSPEQIFEALEEATRDRPQVTQPTPIQQNPFNAPMTPRGEIIAKFTTQDKKHETQTSILQALLLMNGKYLAERTKFANNLSLQTLANQKEGGTAKKVDTLFMMVLSRPPRPEEAQRFIRYVDSGGPTRNHGQALADVYWVLLNSGEFLLNH